MFINFDARTKKKYAQVAIALRAAGQAPHFPQTWGDDLKHPRKRNGKTHKDHKSINGKPSKWSRRLQNRINRANAS